MLQFITHFNRLYLHSKQIVLTLLLLFCFLSFGVKVLANNQTNQVLVRAEVKESLSFAINSTSTLENLTDCKIDNSTKNSVNSCFDTLKASTNIPAGYSITVSRHNYKTNILGSSLKSSTLITSQNIQTSQDNYQYIVYTIIPNF